MNPINGRDARFYGIQSLPARYISPGRAFGGQGFRGMMRVRAGVDRRQAGTGGRRRGNAS